MKRNAIIGGTLLMLVVLAIMSCGHLISGREFSSVVPHVSHDITEGDAVAQARNYSELKKQITSLVENAQTEGVIRLYDYTADVETDLPQACHEVMTEVPIGAYAVDMMSLDHTRVLSYYDVKVSISYKRPREEILAMVSANSAEEFERAMADAIAQQRSPFAVLCNYYTEKIINVAETVEKLRLDQPETAYGIQDTTVQFFPESGLHKVLLVEFLYYETAEESERKKNQAAAMVSNIIGQTNNLTGGERISELCELIKQNVEYVPQDESNDVNTPYGPLVLKKASDMGYACALKQVCNQLGEYAIVVKGTYNGREHVWNMVLADNSWRHVDLSRDVMFKDNSQMAGYEWDDLRYPTDLRSLRG